MIRIENNGKQVMIYFDLPDNSKAAVGFKMDANQAILLAQQLVLSAAAVTDDLKGAVHKTFAPPGRQEEAPSKNNKKPGVEGFMDEVAQLVADATRGLTKPDKE